MKLKTIGWLKKIKMVALNKQCYLHLEFNAAPRKVSIHPIKNLKKEHGAIGFSQ